MASVSRAAKALDDGVLWVGGTSGLALTFFEEELGPLPGEHWVCAGVDSSAPAWLAGRAAFVHVDLTSAESVASLFSRLPHAVGTLIFGARLPLVGDDAHATLLLHLGTLLTGANPYPKSASQSVGHPYPSPGAAVAQVWSLTLTLIPILLTAAADAGVHRVLHISSVAAADHLRAQVS